MKIQGNPKQGVLQVPDSVLSEPRSLRVVCYHHHYANTSHSSTKPDPPYAIRVPGEGCGPVRTVGGSPRRRNLLRPGGLAVYTHTRKSRAGALQVPVFELSEPRSAQILRSLLSLRNAARSNTKPGPLSIASAALARDVSPQRSFSPLHRRPTSPIQGNP
mgnify:CR=1 FL=1